MAITLKFGSIDEIVMEGVSECATPRVVWLKPSMVAEPPRLNISTINKYSSAQIAAYDDNISKAFEKLDEVCAMRVANMGPFQLKTSLKGITRTKPLSQRALGKMKDVENARVKELKKFFHAADSVVFGITIAGGVKPSMQEEETKRTVWHSRTEKVSYRKKVIALTRSQLDNVTHATINIMRSRELQFEIIGKKCVRGRFVRRNVGMYAQVILKHHAGHRYKRDLITEEFSECILHKCLSKTHGVTLHRVKDITYGDSGIILLRKAISGWCSSAPKEMFVIRGNHEGKLYDARIKVSKWVAKTIHHYSSAGEKFWNGFDGQFRKLRSPSIPHTCKSDFSVVECGQIAAILCQSLFPCGRITCRECAIDYRQLTKLELGEKLLTGITTARTLISTEFKDFEHTLTLLDVISEVLSARNTNVDAFMETNRLIGERDTSPFKHINKLNTILIKGSDITSSEYSEASNHVLELARFQKNRTDNIGKANLSVFRNKVSSKSHINLDLMCDNQLDQNGNFVWGKRGYHAKRFLSNYFDIVNPDSGYREHIIRKVPNGQRKLAVGKLIVSTNFETFRQGMKGEPVQKMLLTNECVSKRGNNFIYPCCCVTHDDGTPVESEFKMPTKNHLVIGNAGDAKLVDLPTDETQTMYIAKEGFCYINIFFAMLINVRESQAKPFTKMVRDVLMDKLGVWPTLMDVATACHLLTVFYPDTLSAELPRIMVDHNTKTLHVVDSYGSVSTGYHLLKANTVSQLILFASDSLESEMKHYRVGGKFNGQMSEDISIKLLIKGIYRPKLMEEIFTEEPYLLCLSLISPGVLLALFNSGSLERATQMWLTQDRSVAQIFSILSMLALKISVSRALDEQMSLISSNAGGLLKALDGTFTRHLSVYSAQTLLMRLDSKHHTDSSLLGSGYSLLCKDTTELMEKSYLAELESSWQELSWWEKLSYIMQSSKRRKLTMVVLIPQGKADLKGRYDVSWKVLAGKTCNKIYSKATGCKLRLQQRIYSFIGRQVCGTISLTRYLCPEIVRFLNVLVVVSLILRLINSINGFLTEYLNVKRKSAINAEDVAWAKINRLHEALTQKLGSAPTLPEFQTYLAGWDEELSKVHSNHVKDCNTEVVEFQAKSNDAQKLEQVVAFISLILMLFDAERSDCVYKILNKLKGLMSTITYEPVRFQSLDDIQSIIEDKELTIDFDLSTDNHQINRLGGPTFTQWWNNQLERNNVITHYRTEGHFMEFTRANAAAVSNDIAHGTYNDILVRGAVGSGKSTGLPFFLSKKGSVLMLEPTRPLAENVFKQLKGEPFLTNPTLKMRGTTSFGSSPITIMTSGYAFHYYANNPTQLAELSFIILDECHVHDSSAMAFRCLLHEYNFSGKILKVSATPPGRECEFKTQFPVKLLIEEHLTFQQFVANQGTGANSDVTSHGDNILVYVASYSEVDNLSKALLDKNYRVTKVDGRTMKVGSVEIQTMGTPTKKHFIVATNIIENGVTLDIDVVVDFGTKVVPELDIDTRLIRYSKNSVSFGERIQRLGRVGRNKDGVALRIGHTEKGLVAVPAMTATEAAFLCFAHGLPVMTNGVSTNLLANCTVPQARVMMQFELNPFYTVNFVRFDGSMHPMIHKLLVPYKLRDSEIILNKMAIPNQSVSTWATAKEYAFQGMKMSIPDDVRIPFHSREIPDKLHEAIWGVVMKHKGDAGFGRVSSASACKIAYTLQTDLSAIQRTVQILEKLIENELKKQAYFKNITSASCSSSFSLVSIANAIRSRHIADHTTENISILQAAKNQLMEFRNISVDLDFPTRIEPFGALECVQFQSVEGVSRQLGLKGHWNSSVITQDLIVCGAVIAGGFWMLCAHFQGKMSELVSFQAKNKRQRQKLRFREARDNKFAREVYGEDSDMAHYFGTAYTAKGKTKGTTRGMGTKTRRFINMYNFDPTEYSFARYIDPLTGYTLDEQAIVDLNMVQDHFGTIRAQLIDNDLLDRQTIKNQPGIEAYFVKDLAKQILKVDLTPHNPTRVCDKAATIAGFPDRENELRQTNAPVMLPASALPKENPYEDESVDFEHKSTFHGVRDYNPIAVNICCLENISDGYSSKIFGIGFGSVIITNQHLFSRNNGTLTIQSHHGIYHIKNTTQLNLFPIKERDIVLIQLPKDFPPFSQKLKFRQPTSNEKVCLVGTNFQEKSTTSTVSESSIISQKNGSHFYRHWISTKDGQCGLPAVAAKDGAILGIHSLTSLANDSNFFIAFPENFYEDYLSKITDLDWIKHWKLNVNTISWGSLSLEQGKPDNLFRLSKDITALDVEPVQMQSKENQWLYSQLQGNLKAVAKTTNQLVTKHVVKGKCMLFETYLQVDKEAERYFRPLMGAYQKSRLNKEAYVKDLFKYALPITVGTVDCDKFEMALDSVVSMMERAGFDSCNFVTDESEIFSALNMKAAVGALYSGKKRDYFQDFTDEEKEQIVRDSCYRLFQGKMGVWNGSLKAELRPVEKVAQNKTRSFTAAPLDTLLGGKVCVDDFNNKFYSFNLKCPWSVGMTKFYKGWNTLLTSLPDGWIYCDADGSQFDSSLSPYLINAVLNLRLHFMEECPFGETMLRNLYTEIIYTPIATPDGTIVKKFKGNNSGQPSTVVDNTLMVILAMHYSLNMLNLEHVMDDCCRYFVNGDDLLLAVHPDFEYILDALSNTFEQLGLNYNFDSRTTKKENLWFMSHKGLERDGIYIPKLEPERIVSILEWDRSIEPVHRLEAICASMIEAWGYTELLHEIRKFYYWVLSQAPYTELSKEGKAPYLSEVALTALYMGKDSESSEIEKYIQQINNWRDCDDIESVQFQADETINAGRRDVASTSGNKSVATPAAESSQKDKDVDAGTTATFEIPRLKAISSKLVLPKFRGKKIVNLEHLLNYNPEQVDLSNTRSTHKQFDAWFEGVKADYELDDVQMGVVCNGLMVWCIENGTSPNINGMWVMMDGESQVEYPIKPIIEHAKPTLRQIMAHFSSLAEAYIEKRNYERPYMPRYGLQRNLTDMSLARYAFDFYEMTSKTPNRAREAHIQMKAAALRNSNSKLFGLDGNVGTQGEDTERHTTDDVNRNMHTLMGVRGI